MAFIDVFAIFVLSFVLLTTIALVVAIRILTGISRTQVKVILTRRPFRLLDGSGWFFIRFGRWPRSGPIQLAAFRGRMRHLSWRVLPRPALQDAIHMRRPRNDRFLFNIYLARLFVPCEDKIHRAEFVWKISPMILVFALKIALFIPMGWGAPSEGRCQWSASQCRSCRMSQEKSSTYRSRQTRRSR